MQGYDRQQDNREARAGEARKWPRDICHIQHSERQRYDNQDLIYVCHSRILDDPVVEHHTAIERSLFRALAMRLQPYASQHVLIGLNGPRYRRQMSR
jgi:hypothetical protein